ncbi:triphosphoribosyl-dephospho-CoA synthase [Aurantimonas sp. C2-6-R+9]|uniref:triphosphoribosyl-dephospho-CoA synthase n=1 Tax=unclassified Aurantimonas TaxID=2638230 RepID=UPI002E16BE74|nr:MULTISPECIES: triphosphoribosyl-dephospho-CoA synthase [unclassified Aurantimonas]MEC5290314.1 triphosphoribosyl-dephospho-CoA synthase [Aurantimonas sp. C2-3-R2]MEC5379854.1 triphosphoribosyl-dephospho-CoA synthase [Aurantimonas sp. C2-6-R+9]MEC5411429.1 triphosphoribosyl-dephospho-CoA synthase [Aurantimonas sp. C2-4-R8]
MSIKPVMIEAAFLAACRAELDAVKPGNVHRFAPGHGMSATTFEAAALAAAPFIAMAGASVGARALGATEASWAATGMNTNLGILLLAAPLAAAAEIADDVSAMSGSSLGALRRALEAVLADLGPQDARDVFTAIARASPGGLGNRGTHDVRSPPSIGLIDAMRLAEADDLVARQYANRFREIFDIGVAAIAASGRTGETSPGRSPALDCFIAFSTRFPDSHILRKFGPDVAESIRIRMDEFAKRLSQETNPDAASALLLGFDAELKREGINPGTSADLTVASLFARSLAEAGRW